MCGQSCEYNFMRETSCPRCMHTKELKPRPLSCLVLERTHVLEQFHSTPGLPLTLVDTVVLSVRTNLLTHVAHILYTLLLHTMPLSPLPTGSRFRGRRSYTRRGGGNSPAVVCLGHVFAVTLACAQATMTRDRGQEGRERLSILWFKH